jgi:hypothetical protein
MHHVEIHTSDESLIQRLKTGPRFNVLFFGPGITKKIEEK